jgi:hypothetical protein
MHQHSPAHAVRIGRSVELPETLKHCPVSICGLSGINIGPEPTTDRFVVVESGLEERRTPGNTLVVQPSKPYQVTAAAPGHAACLPFRLEHQEV